MAFALNVNFQPAGVPVPAGYVADTGLVYGARGGGQTFGWNVDNAANARDRDSASSPDQRHDTLAHTQVGGSRTWELAVPNGNYKVHIVGGDADFTGSAVRFNAEGQIVTDGTTSSAQRWIAGTRVVTVSDGRLTIANAAGASNNKISFIEVASAEGPAPAAVSLTAPGTIQAEEFDAGGSGVAYSDTTGGNAGGAYRNTDVDLIASSEGGYAVGYTRPGEWLKYTVDVTAAGNYTLDARVASASSGGVFHVEVDGVDKTGPMNLGNTGGWQAWKTISKSGIALTKGQHTFRLVFDKANSGSDIGNVNWLKLSGTSNPTLPVVSVSATDSSASEPGTNTGKFTITRTGSTAAALTVSYTVAGTATGGSDYNALAGSVTLPAGASSVVISVVPKDDAASEGSESVQLTLVNGSGFALGNASANVTIADNEVVNPQPGDVKWPTNWTKGPNIPKPRWEAATAVVDGKVWVFGGWISAGAVGTQQVDVYDVAANKWSTLSKYAPIPHTHSASASDPSKHEVYFAGGLFGGYPGTPTNRAWKFNTQTQVWTELPSMPENHSSGGLALVNGKLHYLGGVEDDRETNTDRHLVLDLNNLAAGWKAAPDMPGGRDHFAALELGGKLYAIGGEFGHDITHDQQALVHRFDPASNSWQRLADMPVASSHFESSTFVWNGKIVVAGGQVDGWKATDTVSLYDPATDKWSTIGKLPVPLQGPVVQLVGNKLVINGGSKQQGPIGDTWFAELK